METSGGGEGRFLKPFGWLAFFSEARKKKSYSLWLKACIAKLVISLATCHTSTPEEWGMGMFGFAVSKRTQRPPHWANTPWLDVRLQGLIIGKLASSTFKWAWPQKVQRALNVKASNQMQPSHQPSRGWVANGFVCKVGRVGFLLTSYEEFVFCIKKDILFELLWGWICFILCL